MRAALVSVLVVVVAGCSTKRAAEPAPAVEPEAAAEPAEALPPPPPPPPPPVADAGAPKLARGFVRRDVNHVLGTGQSLSVGAVGYPALSRTQPFHNLMFSTGVIAGSANLTAFVPLVEGPVRGGMHPDDETLSSSFASMVSRTYLDHDILVSAHGVGGTPYAGLRKGTAPFAAGMAQVKAAMEISAATGRSYVVRAVTNVHGESDHQGANAAYRRDLAEWQADYEAGVKALTKQVEPVPMIHSQISNWARYGQPTSAIPAQQLAASIASKGKLLLVGPKYHLPYVADGIHLTNDGYRHMGEDYAKVYRRVVLEGLPWEPLRPISVSRSGAVIGVRFAVPSPPLVLDDELVSNPGSYGFEFTQTGPPIAIASVTIAGPDTVTITLAAVPTGGAKRLRYAFTAAPGAPAGPRSGPRGNLRDSDATVSPHGHPLHAWCVHFDEAVP